MGSNPSSIYWMDVSNNVSYYIKERLKIKVAKCGTSKNLLKKENKTCKLDFPPKTDIKSRRDRDF
jgi:hypothetical protein